MAKMEVAEEHIAAELAMGRLLGPLPQSVAWPVHISPMGLVPARGGSDDAQLHHVLKLILSNSQPLQCQSSGHRLATCGNLVFDIVLDRAVVVVVCGCFFRKLREEFAWGYSYKGKSLGLLRKLWP
jgi:hypothetical protein